MTSDISFDIDLWHGPVEDQKASGRCWIYASCNFLRGKLCDRLGITEQNVRLSTNYIYYHDQMHKAEQFLQTMWRKRELPLEDPGVSDLLREPVSSVGQWCYFASLADLYGVVPQEAMPDSAATADGRHLTEQINTRLRAGVKEMRERGRCLEADLPEEILQPVLEDIREILEDALGSPPKQFDWFYRDNSGTGHFLKAITPSFFLESLCGTQADRYIMLIHHPVQKWPVNQLYTEEPDIGERDPFLDVLSVDMDTMMQAAFRQLRAGEQVVIGADIRKDSDSQSGTLFGRPSMFSKAEAILYRDRKACHVMSVNGVKLGPDGRPQFWKVQDSHGARTGGDGHYVMDNAWFEAYVLNAAVRKEYLSETLQAACAATPFYMPKSERF